MRRVAVAVVLGVASLFGSTVHAAETAGGYVDEVGSPTAVAKTERDHDGSGGAAAAGCFWTVVVHDDSRYSVFGRDGSRQFSETGRWLQMVCNETLVYVDGWPLVPERGRVDVVALAQQAARSVSIGAPEIASSPSMSKALYVQVPTWLWIDGSWWRRYEASATAGRVTATVSARPTRSTWSMGDGATATCEGPGVPWSESAGDSEPPCGHTYRRSSAQQPSGAYPIRAEVELGVTWTSNVGVGGTLTTIRRSTSASARVAEIQAIGSREAVR